MNQSPERSTTTLRVSERFPDVSVLGSKAGFDLGFRQLDKGDSTVPATLLASTNVTLAHMRFGRRYHQLGMPPAGKLTFGIPFRRLREWFGRGYRQSSILPFNHTGGIDGVSENNFEAITVSFDRAHVQEVSSNFGISVPKSVFCPTPESVIERGVFSERLRGMLVQMFAGPEFRLTPQTEDELIVSLLHAAQNVSVAPDRSSPRLRAQAVQWALAYIADHPGEGVTVRDICSENNIPLRTLNRAFNERFGVGPKAYLKAQRLSAVRAELLQRLPKVQVTDVANHWGFWHLGQFASDYRDQFGELPSHTISK
ncbi:helix-turn-helix domain-containing protein [Pseudomonadota bacterium]